MDALKCGEATLGEPTLTSTSICFPLKFQEPERYVPKEVIGIDSNERSLDWATLSEEKGEIDISLVSRVNAEDDKRIQRECKGKNNRKTKKRIQRKYGRLRRERTRSFWHIIALQLIFLALKKNAVIVAAINITHRGLEFLEVKGKVLSASRQGVVGAPFCLPSDNAGDSVVTAGSVVAKATA